MPRIMPDERYFSMPSAEVGVDVRKNRALNCWPCVRSLTHSPRRDPLTGCDGCSVTNNGYDITMPARLGSQYAKAIFNIMVRHALDEAGKNFLQLILGRVFHTLNSRYVRAKCRSIRQRSS